MWASCLAIQRMAVKRKPKLESAWHQYQIWFWVMILAYILISHLPGLGSGQAG